MSGRVPDPDPDLEHVASDHQFGGIPRELVEIFLIRIAGVEG
jgi:hypothetical protein